MYATASHANESPKIRADVLRTQAITVDTSPIRRELHEAPNDLLVSLFLFSASHF